MPASMVGMTSVLANVARYSEAGNSIAEMSRIGAPASMVGMTSVLANVARYSEAGNSIAEMSRIGAPASMVGMTSVLANVAKYGDAGTSAAVGLSALAGDSLKATLGDSVRPWVSASAVGFTNVLASMARYGDAGTSAAVGLSALAGDSLKATLVGSVRPWTMESSARSFIDVGRWASGALPRSADGVDVGFETSSDFVDLASPSSATQLFESISRAAPLSEGVSPLDFFWSLGRNVADSLSHASEKANDRLGRISKRESAKYVAVALLVEIVLIIWISDRTLFESLNGPFSLVSAILGTLAFLQNKKK
jgi:hypothetical protein